MPAVVGKMQVPAEMVKALSRRLAGGIPLKGGANLNTVFLLDRLADSVEPPKNPEALPHNAGRVQCAEREAQEAVLHWLE